jgi:ubiquinone/menaquinone biosynthesis C-methylase UbiE
VAPDGSDILKRSWNAFTREHAEGYLTSIGHPSLNSRRILADVVLGMGRSVSVLDLGCGNANLLEYLRHRGLNGTYTGVEFSEPLLDAARSVFASDAAARFVRADVNDLDGVSGSFDVAVYSHVIEMLGAPEQSLLASQRLARAIVIRFFEPPDHDFDSVEIREMEVGRDRTVPYLRRRMGRDYYRLVLARLGCEVVDVYQDEQARDQVHVLNYPYPSGSGV